MSLRLLIYGELLCLLAVVQFSLEDSHRAPVQFLIRPIEERTFISSIITVVLIPMIWGALSLNLYVGPFLALVITLRKRRRGLITRVQQDCVLIVIASIWLATIIALLPAVQ